MVYFYGYYADGLERMGEEGWRVVRLRMQLGFFGGGDRGGVGVGGDVRCE